MRASTIPPVSQMNGDQKQLWDTCQQLEQAFLEMLLKQMSPAGDQNSLLPQTFQKGVYEDMQRQSLAEQMAKSGGIGLASTLYRQMNQQLSPNPVSK